MSDLIEFPLAEGGSVFVATTQNSTAPGAPVFRGGTDRRDVAARSAETMQAAIERVKPAAVALVQTFSDMPTRPEGVSVTFGIELNAELGAVIASTSMSAHFSVTLTWGKPADGAA